MTENINQIDFAKELENTINSNGFNIEIDPNIPVIVVIGNTGVGKSTLINYLSGTDYNYEIKRKKSKFIRDENSEPEKMNVGNSSVVSETIVCQPVYSELLNCYILDTPGFEDSRGEEQKTLNNINIDMSIKRFKWIKCVFLVYEYHSFISENCKELKVALELIDHVFCRDRMSADQFKIVLTKSNEDNSEFYCKINEIFNDLTGVTNNKPKIMKNINLIKNYSSLNSNLKKFESKLKTMTDKCTEDLNKFQDFNFNIPTFNLDNLISNSDKLYKILYRQLLVNREIGQEANVFIQFFISEYNLKEDIQKLYKLRDQINFDMFNNMIINLEFLHKSIPFNHFHNLINQLNTPIDTSRFSLKPYFKYNDYICNELIKLFRCDYLNKLKLKFSEISSETYQIKEILNESLERQQNKLITLDSDLKIQESMRELYIKTSINNTILVYTYEPYKDMGFFYGISCWFYDIFANEYIDHSFSYDDESIRIDFKNGISYVDKIISNEKVRIKGTDKYFHKNTKISFKTKCDERYRIKIEFYNLICNTKVFRNENVNYLNKIKDIKNSIISTTANIQTIKSSINNNYNPSDPNIYVLEKEKLKELSNMLLNDDGLRQLKMLARLYHILDYPTGSLEKNRTQAQKSLQAALDEFNEDLVGIASGYRTVTDELKTDIVCACMSREDLTSKECSECKLCVDLGKLKELIDFYYGKDKIE